MDKPELSGQIRAYYEGISGLRVEVLISFRGNADLANKIAYLEGRPHWSLHAPVDPVAHAVANSKPGKGPYSCPKHGDQKIYKNKKGGDHTHYCAVKEGEEWCGHKIFR